MKVKYRLLHLAALLAIFLMLIVPCIPLFANSVNNEQSVGADNYTEQSVGATTYNEQSVGSQQDVAPAAVSTGAATSITTTTAVIHGNVGSMGDETSLVTSFNWGPAVSRENSITGNPNPITTVVWDVSGAFTATLEGLTPDRTYYVQAQVVGTYTVRGNAITFRTLPLSTKADYYTGFGAILRMAPTVLLLGMLFGSGVSLFFGIKKQKWYLGLIGVLGIVVIVTLFPTILTGINNLLVGNF